MSNEEQIKQQRLKQAQKFLSDVVKGGRDFFKAIETELNKDRSKLRIHQQGKMNQLKKGFTISKQVIEPSLKISQQVTEPLAQGLKISQEAYQKAQTLMEQGKEKVQAAATQAVGAVNSLTEPIKPKQTADRAFAEALQTIDADEKETTAPPAAPEPEKVKDRLLFADGQLQPGVTKQDMLAITELFTSKQGQILQGDAAKGLTVEYDGQLLLKTDRDGRVTTNNLENQELMANFDFRAKNEIAQFQAQAEQLKPRLVEAIQVEAQELTQLKSQVEERLNEPSQNIPTLDPKTPDVQEFNSRPAQQTHQNLGTKRQSTPVIETPAVNQQVAPPIVERAVQQPTTQEIETPVQATEPIKSATSVQVPQQNPKIDRLARVMAVAFNTNYKGEYPAQGRVQAPTGAVIEKTITDEKTKSFDLAIEKDGQKYQIATCKFDLAIEKDGQKYKIASPTNAQLTIKEGMSAALPEIQKIAQSMSPDGKFETPAIVPRMEPKEQQIQQQVEPDGR